MEIHSRPLVSTPKSKQALAPSCRASHLQPSLCVEQAKSETSPQGPLKSSLGFPSPRSQEHSKVPKRGAGGRPGPLPGPRTPISPDRPSPGRRAPRTAPASPAGRTGAGRTRSLQRRAPRPRAPRSAAGHCGGARRPRAGATSGGSARRGAAHLHSTCWSRSSRRRVRPLRSAWARPGPASGLSECGARRPGPPSPPSASAPPPLPVRGDPTVPPARDGGRGDAGTRADGRAGEESGPRRSGGRRGQRTAGGGGDVRGAPRDQP